MDRQQPASIPSERMNGPVFDLVMPLPLPASAMDIYQLAAGRSELVVAFLESLLAGKLLLELPVDFKSAKWAFENQVENQNRTRLHGGHWFWFGFPFVQLADQRKTLVAPLWLWPVSLKAPDEQNSGWTLQQAEHALPQPNPQLDRLFREKLGWSEEKVWWHQVPNGQLDGARLSALVRELMEQMPLESPSQSVSISPWASSDANASAPGSARLIWSGLFGQFPPGFPSDKEMVAATPPTAKTFAKSVHPFGLLSVDPWQATAAEEARRQKGLLIRGAAGSGKTALLQDMIINALSNGERCIVISTQLEVLRDIQQALIGLGLGKLLVFFQQAKEETALVLQLLKGSAREKKKTSFAANRYQQQLTALLEDKAILDQAYKAANKRILGPYTWTQTVGLYLAAGRLESKALLASQLNAQDFHLGYEAYQAMCEQLSRSQALFEAVQTLTHPLTVLNAGIFVHQDKEEARVFIQSKIHEFVERGSALQYRYIIAQNDYGDRLVENYEQFHRKVLEQSSALQEKIRSYRRRFGQDPLESTRTTLKLYARFSDKFRQTLAAKEDLAGSYGSLEKVVIKQNFIQHDFLPIGERHLLDKLLTDLELLQQQLQQWREQLGTLVQDDLLRLSSKTVHGDLSGHEKIAALENELDLLVEQLNDSGLLQLPVENKTLTLPRRQRFLEEVMEKLDRLRFNMGDFDRFFDWQCYWFGLPAEARRIITALVKVKPNNWSAAFSSWYLYQQLLSNADPNLPESLPELGGYSDKLSAWRQLLVGQITDFWTDRRAEVLQKLKKDQRPLYDQLTAKKDQDKALGLESFDQVLAHFFPVILTSPYVSYNFLQPDETYDCLLVDEAQLVDTSLLDIWKQRAKRTVLFDNPTYGAQYLAAWARRQAWPQTILRADYLPTDTIVESEEVAGRYNARQRINDEEARKLLSMLNLVEENPQRTLPRVAIVCFTRAQRNLLLQYLDRIKRQRLAGVEKIQQLERNGLGVYTPDELYGLHTDILLLSATYGRTGATDQLSTDIQQFKEIYHPGIVALLRSRARQSIMLLHSIPDEDLRRLAKDPVESNSKDLAIWILGIQDATCLRTQRSHEEEEDAIHPLAAEIAWQIVDQVRTDRLAFQVPFAQAILPMTVASLTGNVGRVILLNGFLAETPATSYEWEERQQRTLAEAGFTLHPVWSVAWWKRAGQEASAFSTTVNADTSEEE